jgi:hypothetical protein
VSSETAAPPPPVAGAPLGTAEAVLSGAVAAVVGPLVAYSLDSSPLDFGGVQGGGVTQVDVDEVAAAVGLAAASAPVLLCVVIPGMSPDMEPPGAGFSPDIESLFVEDEEEEEEEEPLLLDEPAEDVKPPRANDEDDVARELGVADAVAVGSAVTGAAVMVGNARGTSAGAPAGGAPAPAVEEVESLPDFRPIRDNTTARSTIATSAPMTQAVLFGLSLSGPA